MTLKSHVKKLFLAVAIPALVPLSLASSDAETMTVPKDIVWSGFEVQDSAKQNVLRAASKLASPINEQMQYLFKLDNPHNLNDGIMSEVSEYLANKGGLTAFESIVAELITKTNELNQTQKQNDLLGSMLPTVKQAAKKTEDSSNQFIKFLFTAKLTKASIKKYKQKLAESKSAREDALSKLSDLSEDQTKKAKSSIEELEANTAEIDKQVNNFTNRNNQAEVFYIKPSDDKAEPISLGEKLSNDQIWSEILAEEKAAKEAAEKKLAEEKAAKEAAEKKLAEEKSAKSDTKNEAKKPDDKKSVTEPAKNAEKATKGSTEEAYVIVGAILGFGGQKMKKSNYEEMIAKQEEEKKSKRAKTNQSRKITEKRKAHADAFKLATQTFDWLNSGAKGYSNFKKSMEFKSKELSEIYLTALVQTLNVIASPFVEEKAIRITPDSIETTKVYKLNGEVVHTSTTDTAISHSSFKLDQKTSYITDVTGLDNALNKFFGYVASRTNVKLSLEDFQAPKPKVDEKKKEGDKKEVKADTAADKKKVKAAPKGQVATV